MHKLRDITTKLYAFAFFDDFILIYPLYTLMFADGGLKPVQISSLLIAWSLTAFLLEIPAGTIADKYPRRQVLITGILLRAAGYMCWIFARSYPGFLIGFVLWGAKSALTSGTLEALVYDELNRVNKLPAYAKLMGRMSAIGALGTILASFGASLLAHDGYTVVLWLSVVAVIVSGAAVYALPRSTVVKEAKEAGYLATIKEGVKAVIHRPPVFFLVAFMSIVAGLGAVDEYFNLFFREKGFTNSAVAFWIAIVFLFGALGSVLAHKLEDKKVPTKIALFGWAILLFLTSIAPKFLAPFLLGVYSMFFFGVNVLFNARLQKELGDKTRATATSVGGLSAELFAMLSFLIVGFGARRLNYAFSFQLIAAGVAVCALFLTAYSRAHKLST